MSVIPAVTVAQMREVDRIMVDELHIDLLQMMVPVLILKICYGVAMLGLAYLLVSDRPEPAQAHPSAR